MNSHYCVANTTVFIHLKKRLFTVFFPLLCWFTGKKLYQTNANTMMKNLSSRFAQKQNFFFFFKIRLQKFKSHFERNECLEGQKKEGLLSP